MPSLPNQSPASWVSRWTALFSVVVVFALAAVSASMLLSLRDEEWRHAAQNSESLLKVLEQDIGRNIETYDRSMLEVVDGLNRPEIAEATPHIRQLILFDRAVAARDKGPIFVVDELGKIKLDSAAWPPRDAAIDPARGYFRAHQSGGGAGLYISSGMTSRVSGHEIVALSRRLSHPDGSFAGIVLGAIRLGYFKSLFSQLNLGERGIVSLVRADGAVIAREPSSGAIAERNVGGSKTFQQMSKARSGQIVAVSAIDEVERLFTFTQVGDLPLRLVVARSVDDIYAGWRRKAVLISLIVAVLCVASIMFVMMLSRELQRRARTETAILAANAQLARIAVTDPLTGLFNRRHFDEVMEREARRANRNGQPLSLLILDADHFKDFNDRHGHQSGDDVLRAIAKSILDEARRPGDVAFRIGGEEFAVILAETHLAGACELADRIRTTILGLGIEHADSPAGVVSVSVGAAALDAGAQPSSLFTRADTALYRAKAMGRNRTVSVTGSAAAIRTASAA